ncbi:65-kDa microtubule-associated protein 3-like [Humulus lupulus]|uniref:65-kDa microtubule-associated protein 3-like n=1 Tax=Humulus lupulus TaxID=3486 RepID=UPI002B40DBF7|nr:65-kDa microtubule-associated protein 3-like [Humulus lupulus]XP_062090514.1 65-kDa microtubule-associated protein 3-like [Humulus lupulus]XP_062090515.1 65-kDa microtubule-associated protein 3-like [Humulus lupulus]XP_062090516.1 65-kDa microtubule-associated protein 3-like [Humulus lupulus]
MSNRHNDHPVHTVTICGSMLQELQEVWDELGEPDAERDTMLFEIEQACVEVYRRKVDEAIKCKAQLQAEISRTQAQISDICFALGEQLPHFDKSAVGGLKRELDSILPLLEEMQKRKIDRKNQFLEVLNQLKDISNELGISMEDSLYKMVVNETDLSLNGLEELRQQLLISQNEKRDRQRLVEDHLSALSLLSLVLGVDFKNTIYEIHPTLCNFKGVKDISSSTIEGLSGALLRLREVKMKRWEKLQKFATSMLELWNLMDTPMEEQKAFHNVTSKIAASASEVTEANILSIDFLNLVETEISRLEQLKSSKLREILKKKRSELDEICKEAHMVAEAHGATEFSFEAVASGTMDPEYLLEQTEIEIARAKAEVLSRKEILDKVDKWLAACEEECWLDHYNKDDKRYHAGRGAHLALKRAEKARAVINKIPAMVDTLISKTAAWEAERGVEFLYDTERLISVLDQYKISRLEKEQDKQRQRDQKKRLGQLIAEKEARYGSQPSPASVKGYRITGVANDRKLSLGGVVLQNSEPRTATLSRHPTKNGGFVAAPSGRRDLFPGQYSETKHSKGSAKTREIESPFLRKPLSPVFSSRASSKANIVNDRIEDDHEGKLTSTPPKHVILVGYEGNTRTPTTMPIPMPITPTTVSSAAMVEAKTPCVSTGAISDQLPIEYSFEEVRVDVIHSKTSGK